jgi:hypothetical protein
MGFQRALGPAGVVGASDLSAVVVRTLGEALDAVF